MNSTTDPGLVQFIAGVISLIVLITFFVVAARLRKIMIHTFISGKEPGANHYAEAEACLAIGEKKQALKNYYLAYWAISEAGNSSLKWRGKTMQRKDIAEKIRELGGHVDV